MARADVSSEGRLPTQKRILVLYWHPGPGALGQAVHRHLHALDGCETRNQILYYNAVNGAPDWLRHLHFDVIVFHATLLCLRWSRLFYVWKWRLRWLNDVECVKMAIPQDEYDRSEILDEWLFELGVTVIFSAFDDANRTILYPIMHGKAKFHKCLSGYIDDADAKAVQNRLVPLQGRSMDILYRTSREAYWLGSHGQLKHHVAKVVATHAQARGFKVDIETKVEDTIVGPAWLDFLASGRAVIGCESGSSVLDRRGELRAKIRFLLLADPLLSFEQVIKEMPEGWDRYEFFSIAPSHLEAVVTKTCQVLVEGRYDGVLQPMRHYIPLRPDFANLDEVMDHLKDPSLLQGIAERAHKDIVESGLYTYRRFAQEIERAMELELGEGSLRDRKAGRAFGRAVWGAAYLGARLSEWVRGIQYRIAVRIAQASGYWWMIRHPLVALAKAKIALQLVLGSPALRAIFRRYWKDDELRTHVRISTLLGDLMMLGILQQIAGGRVDRIPALRVDPEFKEGQGVLMLRAVPAEGQSARTPARAGDLGIMRFFLRQDCTPDKILWDHSAVSNEVLYPVLGARRVCFSFGPTGRYEFTALVATARRFPEEVAMALQAVAGGAKDEREGSSLSESAGSGSA